MWTRRLTISAAAVTTLILAGCSDAALTPPDPLLARPALPPPNPLKDEQTSDPGSWSGILPGNDSRTGSGVVAIGSLGPEPVLVQAVASGILAMYPYGDTSQPPGYVDPNGIFLFTEYSCRANVEVSGANGTYVRYCDGRNDNPLVETVSRYAVLVGDVNAWRTGGPQPSFGPACDGVYGDGTPTGPCYTFSGQQTVTLTKIPATLKLEASASEVVKDTPVTFTLSLTPYSMPDPILGQVRVPMRVVAQRWVPDAAPGTTQACGFWEPSACTRPIRESGQMEVDAIVQGNSMTLRARVSVLVDSLLITPATASVKPGIEVTFNAKTKNNTPFTVQSWSYTPDTATGTQLTSVATCGTNKTCKFKPYETGTLTVTGLIQGETTPQTATARVTVQPCPPDTTGDRRIASMGFRKAITEAFDAQMSTPFPRAEIGGDAIVNPTTGQIIARLIPGDTSKTNTCRYSKDNGKVPTLPPGWVVDTADWHAHMQGPKVKFTGCEQPGVTKSDNVTGQAGPSDQDVRGDAEFYRRYGYVIEGPRGDIYGYNNPRRPPPPDGTPSSPIRRWQRDGKSACYVRKP